MKLKKVYAWKILYLILALLDISYYFIKLFLNTEYEKMLIALIAIISFLLMIPKLWIWKTYKKIAIYTIFFLLAISIELIVSFFKYPLQNVNISNLISSSFYLFIPLLYMPLLYVFEKSDGYEGILNILSYIAVTWFIILIFQVIWYEAGGNFFLKNISGNVRFFTIRIKIGNINTFLIFYSVRQLLMHKKQNRLIDYLVVILGISSLCLIQQTRTVIIATIVAVVFMIMANIKSSSNYVIGIGIVVLIMGGICAVGIFDTFVRSFSLNGNEGFSTLNRLNEYSYYWKLFWKNKVFGFGFIPPWRTNPYYNIRAGISGVYFTDDVGIVGMLAQFGLLSTFFFVGWFCNVVARIIKHYRKHESSNYLLSVGLTVFVFISMVSVFVMDQQRIIFMAFYIAIIEYEELHGKKDLIGEKCR